MSRTFKYISVIILAVLAAVACRKGAGERQLHQIVLETEMHGFESGPGTKVNDEGDHFVAGDWIRVRIICPYTNDVQIGERTYEGSEDDFYLLKYNGSSWVALEAKDSCDINANYTYNGSPNLPGIYEAQPTPYVYTASTWSEEKVFNAGNRIVNQFCHVFHADQSLQKNYRASDLLWAQQYMQTGSWNVHLSFHHMLSCLKFTLVDSRLDQALSADAVLTVEGMPEIDQQEVIVGNYYLEKVKLKRDYGYYYQARCAYENNGKVLGICLNQADGKNHGSSCVPFSQIPNTATYRAYKASDKVYRLIVPPVSFPTEGESAHKAVVWIRDGERRFRKELDLCSFQQGKLYDVTINLTSENEQDNKENN